MSPLRRVARTQARIASMKASHNTDAFYYFFNKFWRDKGYPENVEPWNATKKGCKHILGKPIKKMPKSEGKEKRKFAW